MNKFKSVFLHSFAILPLLGTTMSATPLPIPITSLAQVILQDNRETIIEMTQEELAQAAKIDAFFKERDWPLEGHGRKMVQVAKENGLDPFLIPAIASRESSGGEHACKSEKAPYNPFGWHSCKSGFESYDDAIGRVGKHLGGNMPSTARYYKDKDTVGILKSYNPDSIVPGYSRQVVTIMKSIENQVIENNQIAEASTSGQS